MKEALARFAQLNRQYGDEYYHLRPEGQRVLLQQILDAEQAILALHEAEVQKYKAVLVEVALCVEPILMDQPTKKWIAPTIWDALEVARKHIREALFQ